MKVHKLNQLIAVVAWLTLAICNDAMAASLDSQTDASRIRQSIEDPGGMAMRTFYHSLAETARGEAITRIVHYGDSHVAADLMTGALRRDLQQRFGDAGAGFVLAGKPWSWYTRPGVTIRASDNWRANGLSQTSLVEDGRFGLSGISFTATEPGEWVEINSASARFDVYLLKQPGGDALDVWLDGKLYARDVQLAAARTETAYVPIEVAGDSPHTVALCLTKKGDVRLLGIATERDTAGVVYDPLGINGARAGRLLDWDWRVMTSNLNRRDPDLIVIAYGSNEVCDADLDLAEYGEAFSTILSLFHEAAPRASLLVIGPPDRAVHVGRGWQTASRMTALVAVQRRAALASGAAFFDLFRAMGGAGSIARWATAQPPLSQSDRVHLTPAGYRMVAEWIYAELMRGFQSSSSNAKSNRTGQKRN
jgi:lysophospholipase L1-like esterase